MATHSDSTIYDQFIPENTMAILFLDLYLDKYFIFNTNKDIPNVHVKIEIADGLKNTKVYIYSSNSF